MKHVICVIAGAVGAAVAALFGGWTEALMLLGILMIIDYISGLVVAGIFHASPKSEHGGLESHAGLKGLMRKVFILALVAVAHFVDRLIGVNYVRDAVALAFCLNEILSIIENAGLMGIPLPKALRKALDVLRDKAGETEAGPSPVETTGNGEDGFLHSLRSVEMTEGQETAEAKKKPPDEGDREAKPAAWGQAALREDDGKEDF